MVSSVPFEHAWMASVLGGEAHGQPFLIYSYPFVAYLWLWNDGCSKLSDLKLWIKRKTTLVRTGFGESVSYSIPV